MVEITSPDIDETILLSVFIQEGNETRTHDELTTEPEEIAFIKHHDKHIDKDELERILVDHDLYADTDIEVEPSKFFDIVRLTERN
jgi:hypothetical protein